MRTLALMLVLVTASRSAFAADDRPTVIKLTPEQTASLEVKAAPPAPLYTRWYFWVSIGAVVAAGVATAMAISLSNTPKHYTNEEICGKACTTIN